MAISAIDQDKLGGSPDNNMLNHANQPAGVVHEPPRQLPDPIPRRPGGTFSRVLSHQYSRKREGFDMVPRFRVLWVHAEGDDLGRRESPVNGLDHGLLNSSITQIAITEWAEQPDRWRLTGLAHQPGSQL